MSAQAHFQEGRFDEARALLEEAEVRLGSVILLYHASTGYTHLADTALRLLERVRTTGGRDPELERMAAVFEKTLRRFAWALPIGRPQSYTLRGLRLYLDNHPRRAEKLWRRAIAEARRRDMPRDEGVARYEIGRHLGVRDPRRGDELDKARAIFARIGADYWLGMTDAAARSGSPEPDAGIATEVPAPVSGRVRGSRFRLR